MLQAGTITLVGGRKNCNTVNVTELSHVSNWRKQAKKKKKVSGK